MARFDQFTGSSYTPRSIIAASERTVNWNCEVVETTPYKARYSLYRTPGYATLGDSGFGPNRSAIAVVGRTFAVQGARFGEWSALGVFTDYSAASGVYIAGSPALAQLAANPTQVMIVSGGKGYIFTMATSTLEQITSPDFPIDAVGCAFQDGYFIVFRRNSQVFQISALNNGLVWDAADSSSAEAKPDYILACASVREQLWMLGTDTCQAFTNTGAADFPFQSNQGGVTMNGIAAPDSLTVLDDTLFFISGSSQGAGIVVRMRGYQPQRISNYAMESAIEGYPSVSDAEGWGFQMGGHLYYRLRFPSANDGRGVTWQYDVGSGQWTEVSYWNSALALEEAHRGRFGLYCFGKVLIFDRTDGRMYQMAMNYMSDAGSTIRRVRRAPHLVKERETVYYYRLRFDAQVGIGLDVAAGQPGYDPQMLLRWSDDAGKTWSDDGGAARYIRFGRKGEFGVLPETWGLGSARDRVYECVVTDPVDWMIAAAYFEANA